MPIYILLSRLSQQGVQTLQSNPGPPAGGQP